MRIIYLLIVLAATPALAVAARSADYSISLEEVSSSFTEQTGEVQIKLTASRNRIRIQSPSFNKRKRRRLKKQIYASITVPDGAEIKKMSRGCKVVPGEDLIQCRLGRVKRGRLKTRTFRLVSAFECESQITFDAMLYRRDRTLDSTPNNNRTELVVNARCVAPPEFSGCAALSESVGSVSSVSTVSELRQAISRANSDGNSTILIEDGVYTLDTGIQITGNNIMIRSASGKRSGVILQGQGMYGSTSHIFWVQGDNITIADMTLRRVANHAVQIHGEAGADRTLLHNLLILDTREQMVKGSYREGFSAQSIGGIIQCSRFEFSAGRGVQYYTGGIDVHFGKDWTVRDNLFVNIKSPDSTLAEHAIHFWSESSGTLVERNIILNCDRGIGFGLGGRGHRGGIIRNNFVYHDSSAGDVGIGLENAENVGVYHNTIFSNNSYPHSIEFRFSNTTATISNNLTSAGISERDGGSATLSGNLINAQESWFRDPASGDLHLSSSGVSAVGGTGVPLNSLVAEDIDGDPRAVNPDIGADEVS